MSTAPHQTRSGERPHGEHGTRRSAGLLVVGLTVVVLLFLWPYVTLLRFVGSFPTEDVRESLPGAYFAEALCLSHEPGTQQGSPPSPPVLSVRQGLAPVPPRVWEDSSSFYFSEYSSEIIALDRIGEEDEDTLWMLETQRSISREDLTAFLEASNRYYPDCEAPRIDRGITEGYWATKGTSVLHHWVHLYEGSLGGGVHAQYGYAIPWSVHEILEWSSSLGPTSFVRLSWFVFAACGIAYFAVFLRVFREHPRLAVAALLLKVFFFARVGAFALVLAPGFHWYRELVLVAVPALLRSGASSGPEPGQRRSWKKLAAAGAGLLLCSLVEPMYFSVAIFCAAVAALWANYRRVADYVRAHERGLFVLLVILVAATIGFMVLQASNLAYIAQKLRGDDVVVPTAKHVARTQAVCVAALGFLFIVRGRPQCVLHAYFTFVALFSSLYYFVTPDAFHFYKFAEYAVPFYVAGIAFLVDRYGDWFRSHIAVPRRWLTGATAVAFVALAATAIGNLRARPREWERRLEDSFGVPYFQAASFTINGRVIRANMSERLAEHLRAFPASTRSDYVVSPFDKYVTFLYDRTNGFTTPDLVGWLDSSRKLERALGLTAGSDRPVLVLLDEATLDVDTRLGVRESHPVLGSVHLASKINLKGRLRASDLAAELMARCEVEENPGAKGRWRLLRCGRR